MALRSWLPGAPDVPEWGIAPVPKSRRALGFADFFVLWLDLGISFLVLVAGSLLVPGLGLREAILATLVGAVVGNLLLALAGIIGSDTGVPTMVMLRPVLGLRGSYLPTFFNVLQLIGWATFEIIIMAKAADAIVKAATGATTYLLWVVVFAVVATALAAGGPVLVVKRWLERFAIWLVILTTLWLSFYVLTRYDIGELLSRAGTGDLSFWAGVDLVVAMPISWFPLVADYNRFARNASGAFWGTFLGYGIANIWFYILGAVLALTLNTGDLVSGILTLAFGTFALFAILVDETDEGFANIYSTAVSIQNGFPRIAQRPLVLGIGAVCLVLAAIFDITQYENFLLYIGAIFVPLLGVVAADYFVLRGRRYVMEEADRLAGRYGYWGGVNPLALLAWALGILLYWWIYNFAAWLGATIPSFALAFVLYLVLGTLAQRRRRPAAAPAA